MTSEAGEIPTVEPEFIDLLANTNYDQFASIKFASRDERGCTLGLSDHFPKVGEVACHLKLLKAFQVMKSKVINTDPSQPAGKAWKVFLTLASRRFIIFASALKWFIEPEKAATPFRESAVFNNAMEIDNNLMKTMTSFLPPLDVCFIWYCFLSNPSSFYDNYSRIVFMRFVYLPYPLERISKAIDNETFEYIPSLNLKYGYLDIVTSHTSEESNLKFNLETNFSIYDCKIDISCPICLKTLLYDVPLINEKGTGWTDDNFKQEIPENTECICGFNDYITHEELAKRKLCEDFKFNLIFSGTIKWFSGVFYASKDVLTVDGQVRDEIDASGVFNSAALRYSSFEELINKIKERSANDPDVQKKIDVLLGNYSRMRLLYLSMKKPATVWEDLVKLALDVDQFVEKMNQLDWLRSPFIEDILSESAVRYFQFFAMSTSKSAIRKVSIPTIDIDLFWRTHHLSLYYYLQIGLKRTRYFFDTLAIPDRSDLDIAFNETATRYKTIYGEDYGICFCQYCVSLRNNKLSKFKKIYENEDDTDEPSHCDDPPHYTELEGNKFNDFFSKSKSYPHLCTVPPVNPIELAKYGEHGCGCKGEKGCGGGQSYRGAFLNIGDESEV